MKTLKENWLPTMLATLVLCAVLVYQLLSVSVHADWQVATAYSELESVSGIAVMGDTVYATLERRHGDGEIVSLKGADREVLVGGLSKPDGLAVFGSNLIYTQESGMFPVFLLADGVSSPLFYANGAEGIMVTAAGEIFVVEDRPDGNLLKHDHGTGETSVVTANLEEAEGVCAMQSGEVYYTEKYHGAIYRPLILPQAEKNNITLDIDLPGCKTIVEADRMRLKQCFLNFMTNAVKYNKPGGSVTIRCEKKSEYLRINFTDTGFGISAEKQRNLFTPFDRLGRESGQIEGSGIGLVITKQLIEMMHGNLGIISTPDVGSTFWVELRSTGVEAHG